MEHSDQQHDRTAHLADRLQVRTVLNPALWLTVAIAVPFLSAAYAFRDFYYVLWFLLLIASLPVAVCCWAFCYCLIRRPADLRSEEHERFYQAVELIKTKTSKMSGPDAATMLQAIGIASVKQLPDRTDD